MKSVYGKRLSVTAIALGITLLALAAGACSTGSNETVDLLKDPKIGLSHLNDEFHTIKGTLADPKFGLSHLNDEFHTIKGTLADPKFGLSHLNDEFHTIKQMLADLSQKVEAIEKKVQ